MALNDYFNAAFGGDPSAWVPHTYQTYAGRAPSGAEMKQDVSAMQSGAMSPFQQMMGVVQNPDTHMKSYSEQILGRDLNMDPEGYAYWNHVQNQYGMPAMRREMSATPEAINYLLDENWQQAGANSVGNMNAIPGVWSDYAMPGFAHGDNAANMLYPYGPQGGVQGAPSSGGASSSGGSSADTTATGTGGLPPGSALMGPSVMMGMGDQPQTQDPMQGRNVYMGKDRELVDQLMGYDWESGSPLMPTGALDEMLFKYPNSPELMGLWNEVFPNLSDIQKQSLESRRMAGYDHDPYATWR